MSFTKSTAATDNAQSLPDELVEEAARIKLALDQYAIDDKTYINAHIDELESVTDGSSGMDNIGMTPIDGVMTTPQQSLEYLKGRADATSPTLNIASILDYGADPTGITDSTTSVQNAINTGYAVFIPKGDYLITSALTFGNNKQEIYGVGDKSNLISTVEGDAVLKNSEAFFNTYFHDFRIEGCGLESSGILMDTGYEHMYLDRISFVGVGGSALKLIAIYGLHTTGLHIIGDSVTLKGIDSYGSNNVTISKALIKTCKKGIYNIWSYNFAVKNCLIESNDGTGIYAEKANSFIISECYFENNATLFESDNNYDIHISDTVTSEGSVNVIIKDCYSRANNVLSFVKIEASVLGGLISGHYISDFDTYTYLYDIDLKSTGYIKTNGIDSIKLNRNGQGERIYISSDLIPVRSNLVVQFAYLNASADAIEGYITTTIDYHHVQNGGMTHVNFSASGFDWTTVPSGRLIVVTLPIPRTVYNGYFTTALDFSGANANVTMLFGIINNQDFMKISKAKLTGSDASTRFDSDDTTGITSIKGSISYY